MIQRIQTVFLMIAAVALGTQVATPLVKSSVTATDCDHSPSPDHHLSI
jgi:hypothetical protein